VSDNDCPVKAEPFRRAPAGFQSLAELFVGHVFLLHLAVNRQYRHQQALSPRLSRVATSSNRSVVAGNTSRAMFSRLPHGATGAQRSIKTKTPHPRYSRWYRA
jgi:hypothetical protein